MTEGVSRPRDTPSSCLPPLASRQQIHHRRYVLNRLSIACLAFMGAMAHAQTPPDKSAVKITGYKVSAEGGEEGTITYHYDENGKPIKDTPRTSTAGRVETPVERNRGEPRPTDPATTPALPSRSSTLRTADGRTLPFQITGQNGVKTVDESVDADSALRSLTRSNDLLSQRYETGQVDLTLDERFATAGNTVSLDRWQGKASALGARRADVELTDTLGADVRPKNLVEVKAVELPSSPWARRVATPAGWDERVGGNAGLADRRVDRDELSTMGTRANAFPRNPRGIEQLSMQDINRYQFRRARSTDPGLPVGRPGSDGIEKK